MNCFGANYFGDDADGGNGSVIGQGLTDVTKIITNQQNIAAQQQMYMNQSWFEQKAFLGIPNWVLLLGGAAAVYVAVKR